MVDEMKEPQRPVRVSAVPVSALAARAVHARARTCVYVCAGTCAGEGVAEASPSGSNRPDPRVAHEHTKNKSVQGAARGHIT